MGLRSEEYGSRKSNKQPEMYAVSAFAIHMVKILVLTCAIHKVKECFIMMYAAIRTLCLRGNFPLNISKPGVTYGGLHNSTSSAVDNLKFTM